RSIGSPYGEIENI
ncbi:MAG: hypothetical protein EZS28_056676, partial [Streblomastix strix]